MSSVGNASKVVLVTGGNRGLGKAIVESLAKSDKVTTVLGARSAKDGQKVADELNVGFVELDVSNSESIAAAAETLKKDYGAIDVLINNAGIFPKEGGYENSLQCMNVNVFGVQNTTQTLLPLLQAGDKETPAQIIMMSSGMGSQDNHADALVDETFDEALSSQEVLDLVENKYLAAAKEGTEGELGYAAGSGANIYRTSKFFLNALSLALHRELHLNKEEGARDVLVNVVCPGWCRTDMGGENASRSPEQGASGAVNLVLANVDTSGTFTRDGQTASWRTGLTEK